MSRISKVVVLRALWCAMVSSATTVVAAGQYPNGWRGDGGGYWPDAEVPIEWDEPSGNNIRWKVRLPTRGSNGAPVFGPGRVLVPPEPDRVQCFSRADGRLLWQDRFCCIDDVACRGYRRGHSAR